MYEYKTKQIVTFYSESNVKLRVIDIVQMPIWTWISGGEIATLQLFNNSINLLCQAESFMLKSSSQKMSFYICVFLFENGNICVKSKGLVLFNAVFKGMDLP